MDDDVKVFTSNESCELSKNDLIRLLQSGDDNIALIAPEKFKSPIWERFRIVFYKGEKLDFVQCVGCQLVLMYRSRTGTASLLRHRCSRFPVSVQDQKQEAAGRYADLLMDMASSSHNAIELKQEMMSDEESFELKLETDDDQQYENEQTNKGLMESFSLLEKSFMTVDELMLSREEVELAQRNNDPQLCFERPRNHRHSNTWDRFEIVFYRDVRQNFAKCLSCSSIVSYKKTTGTASLIRHKCKNTKSPQPVKQESLITLLTQSKTPPVLTPAPTFEIPTSTVVSSSGRSENPSMLELAAMNLTFTQIRWLCQSLISTEVISDTSYLNFLQSLVNFGADFGKQNISNIINRNVICQQMIPKKLTSMKTELLKSMKGTEFSISFHKWNSLRNNQYITVVGYFFSADFIYRNHILGTKSCDKDDDVSKIVNEIANEYKTDEDMKLKCIGETAGHDFQTFPCIVGQISKVIISAIEANNESKEFFKKIYKVAHEVLDIPMRNSLDDASDIQKIKILFELYQFGNENVDFECDPIAKRFTKLMGSLFSAISSITATSDNGERCVTSNKVYLWFKKLLKLYASLEDDLAVDILKSIEKLKIPDIYQIAVFLDPNFKSLKFLETSERIKLLDNVRKNLRKMIVEDDSSEPSNKKQKLEKTNSKKTHLNDTFLEFMDMSMESTDDQVNSEIQCYMGLKLENPVEIVEFWRDTDCFPYLKKLARNILNMPSCTFHSNCCFIGAGNELYMKFQNLPADEIETSRDRFLESSQQIEALVERFSRETNISDSPPNAGVVGKIPLAYGKPSEFKVWGILYVRLLASTFSCGLSGLKTLFLRIFALPAALSVLWLFYSQVGDDQHGFFSKNSMILNVLGMSYGAGILTTVVLFPIWRKRFIQEYSEGLYSGVTLLGAYNFHSMPFSLISSAIGASVIYPMVLDPQNLENGYPFLYILIALWTSFVLAEQLSIFFLFFIRSRINAAIAVAYIICVSVTLASGTVRSYKGLSPWLQENTKGTHTRYASSLLHSAIFLSRRMNCIPKNGIVCPSPREFLYDRLGAHPNEITDISISIAFAIGIAAFNMIIYLIPTPKCVREKFRD